MADERSLQKTTTGLKIALITGADGALGKQVRDRFSVAGVRTIGTRFPAPGAPPELRESDGKLWLSVDLSQSQSVASAWGLLKENSLEPEAVIHCAGGFRYSPIDAISDADLDFLLSANLRSSLLLARAAVPAMKARGGGRFVFVGARGATAASPNMAVYAATKAAVHSLVQSLAEELKDFGITVNAVLPTIIDTPMNRKDMPSADFTKWVLPAALAEIIFNLTGDAGAPISGALINVPGRV